MQLISGISQVIGCQDCLWNDSRVTWILNDTHSFMFLLQSSDVTITKMQYIPVLPL